MVKGGEEGSWFIYSFVARGTMVLAEFTEFTGNFPAIAAQCLQKLPSSNNKFTYSCDHHTFNFLVHDGYAYCVVAKESVPRHVSIAFLERLKVDFRKKYGGGKADTASAKSLNKEFGPVIKEHMQYIVEHAEEIEKVSKVKAQVSEIKSIMLENIEKSVDRGEKLTDLAEKTTHLHSQVFGSLAAFDVTVTLTCPAEKEVEFELIPVPNLTPQFSQEELREIHLNESKDLRASKKVQPSFLGQKNYDGNKEKRIDLNDLENLCLGESSANFLCFSSLILLNELKKWQRRQIVKEKLRLMTEALEQAEERLLRLQERHDRILYQMNSQYLSHKEMEEALIGARKAMNDALDFSVSLREIQLRILSSYPDVTV
ncbi:uncharacterized protein A4U43_C02F20960 [Asparagus officinalis]|uniref:Longin domain-containing protein n=1 Tax=Asparagus officinalis TaxID=4686 RepID=A0A5P1FKP3_ASPOF|nr:uncharacterized protein A4U43_C02F20960 [Asparagus officinalis]